MTDPRYGFADIRSEQPRPNGADSNHRPGRARSAADFMADHVPPVWLIDGIVQRSRIYACTSLTGHGKTAVWLYNACMIHAGRPVGHLDAFQGNVLILAGENPSDLKARMIGMAKAYDLPREQMPYVIPGSFPMTPEEVDALKREITGIGVPLVLILADTASSFFPGDDENSNVQAGGYARTLRSLTDECEGKPALMVLSHPTKGAARDNLSPRGGGSFLNELDGNLTLWSRTQGEVTEMHWQGKNRGPDFSPVGYRLRSVPTGLIDEKGRPEMTIIAEPMSEEAVADHGKQAIANEDAVLLALRDHRDWSYAQIARHIGWVDDNGQPMKPRVQRAIAALAIDKLVTQTRKGAPWTLTEKGEEAVEVRYSKHQANTGAQPAETAKPEVKSRPTVAEIDAEIARHNALPEKLREADRRDTAKRLGMRAGVFEKLANAQEPNPPEPDAKPPAAAARATEADIAAALDWIAKMTDAAFLARDRAELAGLLGCRPSEVATMRRRAQDAIKAEAKRAEKAAKVAILANTVAARAGKSGKTKGKVSAIVTAKAAMAARKKACPKEPVR